MTFLDTIFGDKFHGEYVVISRVTHGKLKGQFRFNLVAPNNEVIATSETYNNKGDVIDLLEKFFPKFTIVDKTKK